MNRLLRTARAQAEDSSSMQLHQILSFISRDMICQKQEKNYVGNLNFVTGLRRIMDWYRPTVTTVWTEIEKSISRFRYTNTPFKVVCPSIYLPVGGKVS